MGGVGSEGGKKTGRGEGGGGRLGYEKYHEIFTNARMFYPCSSGLFRSV